MWPNQRFLAGTVWGQDPPVTTIPRLELMPLTALMSVESALAQPDPTESFMPKLTDASPMLLEFGNVAEPPHPLFGLPAYTFGVNKKLYDTAGLQVPAEHWKVAADT